MNRLCSLFLVALFGLVAAVGLSGRAHAQNVVPQGKPPGYERNTNVPLSYGHYCGVGNSQQGVAPLDALDRACMQHDACAGSDSVPKCSCHRTFEAAAGRVAKDPNESELLHKLATNMIAAISKVPCSGR